MKDKIEKILDIFESKNNWCWGWYALDIEGNFVPARSFEACSWCLAGAMMKVAEGEDFEKLFEYIKSKIPMTVGEFNDFMGYEAVIKLLKDIRDESIGDI